MAFKSVTSGKAELILNWQKGQLLTRSGPQSTGLKNNCRVPDAIALLSLEAWAIKEDKKILAISTDRGWLAYDETSDQIDVVDDFAAALQMLQKHAEAAKEVVANFLSKISEKKDVAAIATIEHAIEEFLEWTDFDGDAEAEVYADVTEVSVTLEAFDLDSFDAADFNIVRVGKNSITFVFRPKISVYEWGAVSFTYNDNYGTERNIGDMELNQREELSISLLVSLVSDPNGGLATYQIEKVELLNGFQQIDFGDVQGDFLNAFGYEE